MFHDNCSHGEVTTVSQAATEVKPCLALNPFPDSFPLTAPSPVSSLLSGEAVMSYMNANGSTVAGGSLAAQLVKSLQEAGKVAKNSV